MPLTYAVMQIAPDWTVLEDGAALVAFGDRSQAIEMGQLLTLSAKAAGREAAMMVEGEGGRLRPWDVERALFQADNASTRRSRRSSRPREASASLSAVK